MTAVRLEPAGEGRWLLAGDLDFATVPQAWNLLRPLLDRPGAVTLSLQKVQRANSAALGLLLEGLAQARNSGCELRLEALPQGLRDLAQVSNIDALIDAAAV
jgi:phospholipid transport system transporter-binding protein